MKRRAGSNRPPGVARSHGDHEDQLGDETVAQRHFEKSRHAARIDFLLGLVRKLPDSPSPVPDAVCNCSAAMTAME
jgi:hypothetical protein